MTRTLIQAGRFGRGLRQLAAATALGITLAAVLVPARQAAAAPSLSASENPVLFTPGGATSRTVTVSWNLDGVPKAIFKVSEIGGPLISSMEVTTQTGSTSASVTLGKRYLVTLTDAHTPDVVLASVTLETRLRELTAAGTVTASATHVRIVDVSFDQLVMEDDSDNTGDCECEFHFFVNGTEVGTAHDDDLGSSEELRPNVRYTLVGAPERISLRVRGIDDDRDCLGIIPFSECFSDAPEGDQGSSPWYDWNTAQVTIDVSGTPRTFHFTLLTPDGALRFKVRGTVTVR